jgi:hypothetical protein
MHIALQTGAFENVEVHAVVRESQVGLAIGSERGDLHRMLANEVPNLLPVDCSSMICTLMP